MTDPFYNTVLPSSTISDTYVADFPNISPSIAGASDFQQDEHQECSTNLNITLPSAIDNSDDSVSPQSDDLPTIPNTDTDSQDIIRRTSRVIKQPAYLKDYECNFITHKSISTPHHLNKVLTYC